MHRIPFHQSSSPMDCRTDLSPLPRIPSVINSPCLPTKILLPKPRSRATPLRAEAAGGGERGGVKQALSTSACGERCRQAGAVRLRKGPTLRNGPARPSEDVPTAMLVPFPRVGRRGSEAGKSDSFAAFAQPQPLGCG
ncbi:hypothetical protein H8958_011567 [Nasalis larvatus]